MERWFRCIGHRECAAKDWAKRFVIGEPYELYKVDDPPICLIMVDPDSPEDSWYVDGDQFEEIIEGEEDEFDFDNLVEFIASELKDLNTTLARMNILLDAIKKIKETQDGKE